MFAEVIYLVKIEQFNKNYDVFRSFLVKGVDYDGIFELPKIKTSDELPNRLVSFSKAMSKSWNDFETWVMFYEYDVKFERLWNNPKKYLNKLKKFKGVISPDFSLYRNMPFVMQLWNTYRGRALAVWLQSNGIEVIPNIRFNDIRTFAFCFDGIEKNKTVAIGTHGCIKQKTDKEYFKAGLAELIHRLSPQNLVIYGRTPEEMFREYANNGINIISFDSEFAKSRKQVTK